MSRGVRMAPTGMVGAPGKRPVNAAAWSRSSASWRVASETSAYPARFASSDQKSPWLTESRPVRPKSWVGRSQAWPKGPASRIAGASTPSLTSTGMIRV